MGHAPLASVLAAGPTSSRCFVGAKPARLGQIAGRFVADHQTLRGFPGILADGGEHEGQKCHARRRRQPAPAMGENESEQVAGGGKMGGGLGHKELLAVVVNQETCHFFQASHAPDEGRRGRSGH
ncbi:MAG: hypothetical protein B7Z73_01410 [Planctomycetia bacterium 21-64-5]|nr:MAG: hypothetical protein B7Z73_01410 [Planctomycetia bacterium 21-64-5]